MSVRWRAGLLEGEGSFGWQTPLSPNGKRYGRPIIHFGSTDPDVTAKLAKAWKVSPQGPYGYKQRFPFTACGCMARKPFEK